MMPTFYGVISYAVKSQHDRVHSIDRYRKEIGVDVLSELLRSRAFQNTLENPRGVHRSQDPTKLPILQTHR
jgi:hypothetical protein